MINNINKITRLNLTNSMFECSIFDRLVFNTSVNKVLIFTVNLTSHINNVSTYWEYLSIQEKIKASKYYTEYLSKKYIISHGILRYILGFYTKQHPQKIEFNYSEYGKPFLKNSNIQFNMSHSCNMVSYMIALNYRVGIDIELHDKNLNIEDFADLVLTPEEYKYLSSLKSRDKLRLFYILWTKKEALVKAIGQGLSYPINTIEVIRLLSGKGVLLNDKNNELRQPWYCYELEVPENYSGAIGIENKIDEIVYLEMNNQQNNF